MPETMVQKMIGAITILMRFDEALAHRLHPGALGDVGKIDAEQRARRTMAASTWR